MTLPKKGDLTDAVIGEALLSIPDKVFCNVLLNTLKTEVGCILTEEQAGLRCNIQIFTLPNITEQSSVLQTILAVNFVNLKKFDSVHIQRIVVEDSKVCGIAGKYTNIIKAL